MRTGLGLQAHDIDRIDYLVVSHNDAKHIGGSAEIIESYETHTDGIELSTIPVSP